MSPGLVTIIEENLAAWKSSRINKHTVYADSHNISPRMLAAFDEIRMLSDPVSRERHTENLVGRVWRVNNPETIRVGNCFLKGRLKEDDMFLCSKHSGDCFQTYILVNSNYDVDESISFGSYGIGDSECVELGMHQQVKIEDYMSRLI